jgi:GNAT superfamily N-acetyltransferase
MLICRHAAAADLATLVALLNDDQLGKGRNPLYADAAAAYEVAFQQMQADPNNYIVVAEIDGRVSGCYQLTFIRGLSYAGALRAQIESVRIASALRGGGHGTVMMRDAIRRAEARGCRLVQLTTDIRRTESRRFYERLGFAASHHGMKLWLAAG